ncbi:hypothetical protein ACPPVV_07180 [Rhodanobacter sp. Col0626]
MTIRAVGSGKRAKARRPASDLERSHGGGNYQRDGDRDHGGNPAAEGD